MANKPASPVLVWTLVAVCILVLPTAIIRLIRPDALDPSEHRPTGEQYEIKAALQTGVTCEHLHLYSSAISWFQRAERAAASSSDEQYDLLQQAREHLAAVYEKASRSSEAQQTYQRMIQSSTQLGDSLAKKEQYSNAVGKFEDAEKFAQHLSEGKIETLQTARFRAVGCYFALRRNDKAAETAGRLIETQQLSNNPYDAKLASYYEQMAFARSGMGDWPGAEEALHSSISLYDDIVRHYSEKYDPEARDLNAKQERDLDTMQLALVYFNEKKLDLAESTAETAYQALSQRMPQNVPYQLISVGLQSATALGNQEQEGSWQQRMHDLCRGPNCGP